MFQAQARLMDRSVSSGVLVADFDLDRCQARRRRTYRRSLYVPYAHIGRLRRAWPVRQFVVWRYPKPGSARSGQAS